MWHLLLLHALFASTYTIGKAALEYVEPIFFVALRMILSGIILIGFQLLADRKQLRIKKKDYSDFFQLSFFLFYLSYVLDFSVLENIDSSKWALLFTLSPFVIGLFSYFLLDEQITLKKLIGFIIGFMGIIPVLLIKTGQEGILGSFWIFSMTEVVIIISILFYSYGLIITRKLIRYKGYHPIAVNGITMLLGGLFALITSPFIDTWKPSPVGNWFGFINLLVLIIAANLLVYIANSFLLRIYTATFTIFLGFIDPIYVALYGWIFLSETVGWYFVFSVIFVIFGLYIFYQEELGEGVRIS